MQRQTDSRQYQRAQTGVAVRYWEWNQAHKAEAVELSAGGLFLRTKALLAEGKHLTLRLELPGQRGFTVLARVVRTVKGGLVAVAGMGVRCLDLSPSQQAEIIARTAVRTAAALRPVPSRMKEWARMCFSRRRVLRAKKSAVARSGCDTSSPVKTTNTTPPGMLVAAACKRSNAAAACAIVGVFRHHKRNTGSCVAQITS